MNRLRDEIAERKRTLEEETKAVAAQHMHGRKMTDRGAMRRPQAKAEETRARRAPQRMAKLAMYQVEDTHQQGLELDVGEVSDRVAQSDILESVDEQTKRKKFDIRLEKMGPYTCAFSNNGTDVALCGLRGHLATFRWQEFKLEGEVQLKDRCTSVTYLVDNSMLAVAQKRFVYMYTKAGVEMHLLQNMANCDRLAYLPNHMLLAASSTQFSVLHWMDVSTGKTVASKGPHIVKDPITCLGRNPANGILASGDLRGIVKLWSPTVEDPVVQLKAHKGAVKDAVFHHGGRFALTLGIDNKFKVWDTRTLRVLDEYGMNYVVDAIDVSAKGLVALGGGTGVQLWKDMFTTSRPRGPFLKHSMGYGNVVNSLQFCPFEDVLGVGHSNGFSTMLVPGAGEANPDFFVANPYETETHRKSRVVTSLLDKLPPETISMDLQIAGIDENRLKEYNEKLEKQRKLKGIRERKRKSEEGRPVQPTHKLDADDEIDEELGVREGGVSKLWKPKKEILKERKMANWQKKDTSDKIRSKQTMRTSKIARQNKMKRLTDKLVATVEVEDGETAGKKTSSASTGKQRFAAGGSSGTVPTIGHSSDAASGTAAYDPSSRSNATTGRRRGGDSNDVSSDRTRKELATNAAFRRFGR